ncbi:hypothetical protein BOX15_Mlig018634g1 [Macrostomum lignano]|uniref:Uncharacterized protein n=1 Tax=Macrostomum lignano TaxID=282301 RepID=A0A267DNM0_9PLAT|nr:hypothetical protein BOX15_Mlig018634g1 [Macrostomum lignano]
MDDLSPDSDSNQYDSEPSSYPPPQSVGGQLSMLNTALVDTNRNLRSIDKLMALYRNTTDRQAADMNRLKEDLHRVTSEVRLASRLGQQTPYASSPNVATAAAASSAMDPGSHMRRASSVRFLNGAGAGGAGSTEELHEVHQRLRDLGTEQSRLREELRLKPSPDEARLLREELDRVRAAERAPSRAPPPGRCSSAWRRPARSFARNGIVLEAAVAAAVKKPPRRRSAAMVAAPACACRSRCAPRCTT